jgi:hypothetical protein
MSAVRMLVVATSAVAVIATVASAQTVGVPACDNFLKTYQSCIATKAPAQTQAQLKSTLEQVTKNWAAVAATADGKKQLEGVCKQTADQMKQQLANLSCSW